VTPTERIHAAIASAAEPVSAGHLIAVLALPRRQVYESLVTLRSQGRIRRVVGMGTAARWQARAPSNLVRLPIHGHMVRGEGERDDTCDRYEWCLSAHVFSTEFRRAAAHCPPQCAERVPADRDAALCHAATARREVAE
jgi:hypothetical protein